MRKLVKAFTPQWIINITGTCLFLTLLLPVTPSKLYSGEKEVLNKIQKEKAGFMLGGGRSHGKKRCTPDPHLTSPGFYPEVLPIAKPGAFYATTLSYQFPKDTTILSQTVSFDFFRITRVVFTKISGLPPNFQYRCNYPRCSYPGGGPGCINFKGSPGKKDAGNYRIIIEYKAYVKLPPPVKSKTYQAELPLVISQPPCKTDSTLKHPGYRPDSFPNGIAGQHYEQVIQMLFPEDSTVQGFTATFDSFVINETWGMPYGYGYQCSRPRCDYPGGSRGCMLITGDPHDSQAGNYNIIVKATAYLTLPPPYPTQVSTSVQKAFSYTIEKSSGNFIVENAFKRNVTVYPNPFSHQARLVFYSRGNTNFVFQLTTMGGKMVRNKNIKAKPGKNEWLFKRLNLKPGFYVIRLMSNKQILNGKMIIRNRYGF